MYYVTIHLMLYNIISNEIENDWLKINYVMKNCDNKKTLNLNYQMKNWWRELKLNYFALYLGKQKVNQRKT